MCLKQEEGSFFLQTPRLWPFDFAPVKAQPTSVANHQLLNKQFMWNHCGPKKREILLFKRMGDCRLFIYIRNCCWSILKGNKNSDLYDFFTWTPSLKRTDIARSRLQAQHHQNPLVVDGTTQMFAIMSSIQCPASCEIRAFISWAALLNGCQKTLCKRGWPLTFWYKR